MMLIKYFILPCFIVNALGYNFIDPNPEDDVAVDVEVDDIIPQCVCSNDTFNSNMSYGIIKSPRYPTQNCATSGCVYAILPHPTQAIYLDFYLLNLDPNTNVSLYLMYDYAGNTEYLLHTKFTSLSMERRDSNYRTFMSPINVGFFLLFESYGVAYNQNQIGFFAKFERLELEHVCGFPFVPVDTSEIVIQQKTHFALSSGCVYRLESKYKLESPLLNELKLEFSENEEAYIQYRIFTNDDYELSQRFQDQKIEHVDATRVEILNRQNPISHSSHFNLTRITATLVNRSCDCGKTYYMFPTNASYLLIDSPGYPDLFCPGLQCKIRITFNTSFSKGVIFLNGNYRLTSSDTLQLEGYRPLFEGISTNEDEVIDNIMLGEQDLTINYETSYALRHRFFRINITTMHLRDECKCSKSFKDDFEHSDGDAEYIYIPKNCSFVYCHQKISSDSNEEKRTAIGFHVDYGTSKDKLIIHYEDTSEIYSGLYWERPKTTITKTTPVALDYIRNNVSALMETLIFVEWRFLDPECLCDESKYEELIKENQSFPLTSPSYDAEYCSDMSCTYSFHAEENQIFEILVLQCDTEHFHDFLRIYDGNSSSSPILAELSGHLNNLTFKTTQNKLFFEFTSDLDVVDEGYKIIIKAVAIPGWVVPSRASSHWLFYFAIILLIALVVGSLFIYSNKQSLNFLSFENISVGRAFINAPEETDEPETTINSDGN